MSIKCLLNDSSCWGLEQKLTQRLRQKSFMIKTDTRRFKQKIYFDSSTWSFQLNKKRSRSCLVIKLIWFWINAWISISNIIIQEDYFWSIKSLPFTALHTKLTQGRSTDRQNVCFQFFTFFYPSGFDETNSSLSLSTFFTFFAKT